MSGNPSVAEIDTQLVNWTDVIETNRAFADGSVAGAGNTLDVLLQALEGEYTPAGLTAGAETVRANLSGLLDPGLALIGYEAILREYGRVIGFGGAYLDTLDLIQAVYEYFVANSKTVQSRAITYDASVTAGGSNVGNGVLRRLTVDENAYALEAVTVETKIFRVRRDQNTGLDKWAEQLECLGEASSRDNLLISSHGSGESGGALILARHAGNRVGGTLLNNASFQTYSASASPKFTGWDETSGGTNIAQNTSTHYRTFPGNTSTHSLQFNGNALIKQTLASSRLSGGLDVTTPYFCRLMWNRQSSADGTLTLRMGSQSIAVDVTTGTNGVWNELVVAIDENLWPRNFNEDTFDIEIELASRTTGTVLVDDVIFCPWDLIDGSYYLFTHNAATPTANLVDDTYQIDDTGGAPATGKIQYWFWRCFGRHLPSAATPSISDPS